MTTNGQPWEAAKSTTDMPKAEELLELYGDRKITVQLPARWLWREFSHEKNTRFMVLQQLRRWYEEEHGDNKEPIRIKDIKTGKEYPSKRAAGKALATEIEGGNSDDPLVYFKLLQAFPGRFEDLS